MTAISCRGLTRRFGDFTAVDDISLNVAAGQFFGFLGPNGAGKSTTIKMLTGLLEPTSGEMQVLGQSFGAGALELKRQIGVVPEGMALLARLTAAEYLRFVGRMYGLDRETANRRTAELLDFMNLASEPRKLITDFSHGMQKKACARRRCHPWTEGVVSRRTLRRRRCSGRRHSQSDAAGDDPSRGDDLSYIACAGNCRAAMQSCGDHRSWPRGGEWFSRRVAVWRGIDTAGARPANRKLTLEEIFSERRWRERGKRDPGALMAGVMGAAAARAICSHGPDALAHDGELPAYPPRKV